VRQALDAITDLDWQSRDNADRERVAAFRAELLDDVEDKIHALDT
jgi:hypothetical protein